MVHRITLISEEVEDFILELKISADATFLDLHKLIIEACSYTEHPANAFFICDEDWEEERTIRLSTTGSQRVDEDEDLMAEIRLGDVLEDENQRLRYLYDPEGRRAFLMELTENTFGQKQDKPICNRRHGQAPSQFLEEEELPVINTPKTHEDIDEDFYGSEGYDNEEFDPEGFAIEDSRP